MPKHYCDYCDVFLTHDSTSVRKAHNSGRNHLANVKDYYASLGHDKAQLIIDQITSAYESGGGPPPGGFGFGPQHLLGTAPMFPGGPGGRPPFPPPPGGFGGPPPPGWQPPPFMNGAPPFPPNLPPGVAPPFPPNLPPGVAPPFPPNLAPGGAPPNSTMAPPTGGGQDELPPGGPSSGPTIHPDRMKMLGINPDGQ